MSYIIGFFNNHKIQVDDETGEKLKSMYIDESSKGFEIAGDLYTFSSISCIIQKDTAYDVYPKDYELLQNMKDEEVSNITPQLSNQRMLE